MEEAILEWLVCCSWHSPLPQSTIVHVPQQKRKSVVLTAVFEAVLVVGQEKESNDSQNPFVVVSVYTQQITRVTAPNSVTMTGVKKKMAMTKPWSPSTIRKPAK